MTSWGPETDLNSIFFQLNFQKAVSWCVFISLYLDGNNIIKSLILFPCDFFWKNVIGLKYLIEEKITDVFIEN